MINTKLLVLIMNQSISHGSCVFRLKFKKCQIQSFISYKLYLFKNDMTFQMIVILGNLGKDFNVKWIDDIATTNCSKLMFYESHNYSLYQLNVLHYIIIVRRNLH